MKVSKVQVFLSTYNGEKYLSQQLDSIIRQKQVEVSILVRDDGSTDSTVKILEEYKKKNLLNFYTGENIGYGKSFMHLLTNAIEADYFALSDQDDVWNENKVIAAINFISEKSNLTGKPLLYASCLTRVDENLKFKSMQGFAKLKISIGGEFARHRLAGCTFLFNKELLALVKNSFYVDDLKCSHDELMSLMCLVSGGKLIFDHNSYILFRRHRENASCDSVGFIKKFFLEFYYLDSRKFHRSNLAKYIIKNHRDLFSRKEDLALVENIANYRSDNMIMLKLACSTQITSGFWYYDLFLKILILCKIF